MRTATRERAAITLVLSGNILASLGGQQRPQDLQNRLSGWQERLLAKWSEAGAPELVGNWTARVCYRVRQPYTGGNAHALTCLLLSVLASVEVSLLRFEISQEEPALIVTLTEAAP